MVEKSFGGNFLEGDYGVPGISKSIRYVNYCDNQ